MAQFRAKIQPGQIAMVGDLRFGPGQLLPPGTTEYQVIGTYELESFESYRDVEEVAYSVTVPADLPGKGVQELIGETVSFIVANKLEFASSAALDTDGSLSFFSLR